MKLRNLLLTAHLCVGLISAPLLLGLGLSGAVLAFENELAEAMNARLWRAPPGPRALSLADMKARVDQAYPGAELLQIELPADAGHSFAFSITPQGSQDELTVYLDPYTGQLLGTSAEERTALRAIHQFHLRFLAGKTGAEVAGWMALALLFLSISGLILWWPGKLLRLRGPGLHRRTLVELHHVLGAWSWLFLLVFSVTGAIVHWEGPVQEWLLRVTGSGPLPPPPPATHACAGKPMLPLDQLLAAATAAVPEARPTLMQFGKETSPIRLRMKFPEDHTPAGRTNVLVERCSARILQAQPSRAAPLAYRLTRIWNRELHTGDVLGLPTRVLACAFSLILPMLALTGPLLWWTKRQRRARPGPD